MTKPDKEKIYLKRQIIKILNDNEFYMPEMIIEEAEPFFWRLSPRWVKDKAERIVDLVIKGQNEKTK
jgi:hypothetical protein